MLSRKVVTRSGRGFRGYFPSKKLNRHIEFESIMERDAITIFENSSEVSDFQEQPCVVNYYDENGDSRIYYPDFALTLADGVIVHVEVKPYAKLIQSKIAKKLLAIHQLYLTRPEHFVILTEKELRSGNTQDIYQLLNNKNIKLVIGGQHAKISF